MLSVPNLYVRACTYNVRTLYVHLPAGNTLTIIPSLMMTYFTKKWPDFASIQWSLVYIPWRSISSYQRHLWVRVFRRKHLFHYSQRKSYLSNRWPFSKILELKLRHGRDSGVSFMSHNVFVHYILIWNTIPCLYTIFRIWSDVCVILRCAFHERLWYILISNIHNSGNF